MNFILYDSETSQLIDIDAKDVDQAQKIAEEQPFFKWLINPEEAIYHDDYLIEIDSVQPRRGN